MHSGGEPIKGRKVRFALVGCGRIAKNHFHSMQVHAERAELVDVCDTDPAALREAVAATGARGHADIESLLAKTTADCVVLTTPSGIHSAHAIQVAATGRHVLTEKPMATRWQDGVDMLRACNEANVRLFVVKQNRRNATLQLLKSAVEKKRFGRIYMIVVNVFWQRPQDYYDQAAWRGTWALDGGAFMNQASHYVDLLEWIGGPVQYVQAIAGTLGRNIEVEDTGVITVQWRNGAMGSLNCTMLTYPKNLEGSITVLGERGTARIGGVAVNEILEWQFEQAEPEDEGILAASYETTSVYGFGHPLYYDNVVSTLTGQAEPDVDGASGLRSLELLCAAYRSIRDGVRVGLPLSL
jgi:UDP-N-acetyl-2-amino-2-deoxyglucuronate dehydrogenase